MFLESTKGKFDNVYQTEHLLERFGESLGNKNQAAMEFTVNASMESLKK